MLSETYFDGENYYIKHSDGTISKCDPSDLFEKCDLLLHMYGIGNHKTFSEFVDMVNDEDPTIINGLFKAATKRIESTYGTKGETSNNYKIKGIQPPNGNVSIPKYDDVIEDDDKKMEMFLRFWGASKEEIEEAKKKIDKRKISKEDISWINSKDLIEDGFDLKKALASIKRSREGCVNIKVSLEKLMNSRKNG